MRAPDAAQRHKRVHAHFDALWRCAADPGSIVHSASPWVPALRCTVKNAAPRPGHESFRRRSPDASQRVSGALLIREHLSSLRVGPGVRRNRPDYYLTFTKS